MDINAISTLITTVGFPIVACGFLAWYVKYQTDQNNQEVSQMRKEHKEELEKVSEALNRNTVALEKLCTQIDEKTHAYYLAKKEEAKND